MRNEYRQRTLTSSEVSKIWKEFYNTYTNLRDVLKEAREEDTESLDRLYKYWDKAGLPYSYKEAFAQFIADRGYISFESYDFSKSPLDNTRAARNNMLIKLIQERLMDYETFEQRYTPGGFTNASKAARNLRELLFGNLEGIVSRGNVDFDAIAERAKDKKSDPEPNYDPSDPMTIITYNQQNQVAGKLIGIFANQNTNHAFSSLMREFTLKLPIKFAGHSYDDLLHAPKGIDVDLNVAEFLAASVDAVKDPVLNFLNLNTITADAGAVLARLGYTTQEIGLLFNQPIIKEICEYSFNNGVTADMAMREVVKNYMGDDTEIPIANPDEDFSINKLALNIVNDRVMREQGKNAMDNQSFKADQLKIAELFSQIQTVAGDVSQFVTSTKFTASNAVGSTFGDLYSQQMKVKNYIDKFVVKNGKNALSVNMKVTDIIESPITNDTNLQISNQEYLESLIENPLAYEQAMYDMNRRANSLLNSYYPYETPSYRNARNKLASLTKSNFLDADTINSIHSDMLVYMLSQQEGSLFNGEIPTKDGIPAREYYTKHFAKEVFNTLESNPDLKSLPLFQYMQFVTDEKTGDISMNVQGIGGLAPYQKDELKESWAELLKTEPDLARDLFMYNFYKLGFTFSPLAFMNLAPTELKLAIKVGRKWDSNANNGNGAWVERSYIDFLNDVMEGYIHVNSEKFAKQYILNHLDNRKLVFTAKGSNLKYLKTLVYKGGEAVPSFTLDASKLGDDATNYTIKDKTLPKNFVAFRPCIVVDGIVYMCESGNDKFNVSTDGSITYYKVTQLGTTNKSLQYISDSESKLIDSEQYNNNTEGNSSQEFISEDTPTPFNREEAINQIIDYGIKKGEFIVEQVESIKEYLNSQSDTDLSDTVNAIKSEIQSNGLTDNTGEKFVNMAESCSIFAHCKNSKGEVVESRLFKDLLHYTSNNRELAKEYYGIGINPKFLEKVQDKAKFDENGEITFQSLRKLAKLNVGRDNLLNTLNKDINSGIYDYEEAIPRLQSFNRNSQFSDEFMATITSIKDGKYSLSVVERNPSNELALNQEISNRTLQDRIKYYLNKVGVGIKFIENDEKINGRYSTKNAKRTADGLYQLIQVANGKNVTEVLAEEAGHFAVGALGESPLVERLMRLLTPEVQKQIVGDEYDSKYLGESSKREIAGTLVGQAIAGNIDDRAPWQTLAKRIVNMAKRIFHSIKSDNITNSALEAERIADMIAKGFMSPNFTGNVKEALKTKETLYNAPTSFNVRVFKQVVNRLKLQTSEMKSISNSLFDKFNNIVGQVESGRNLNVPSSFADAIALEGITEAIVLMNDLMVAEIPDTLASVDFDNVTDFNSNMPANAKALRVVRTFARNALTLIDLINSSTSNIYGADRLFGDTKNVIITDSLGNRVSYNLLDITDKLNKLLTGRNGLINELKNKESQFFLKFLEGSNYGNKYITRAARVVFNWKNRGNNKLIEFRNSENVPISDLMNSLESDISLFERFLASMSNNSDVIGQLADKTVKLANKWADDMSNQAQDQLRILQSKLKDIGLSNTDIFIERSERDGTITGNIISPYCWGDYENDWLEFKKQNIEEFNQMYPNLDGKSDFEKALLWDNFFKPKAKIWHKGDGISPAHSQWDTQQQMYIPSADYESDQYNRDIRPYPERVKWLNEYMQLKADLDRRLPEGSMPLHRMPQFKGTFSNKIRNRRLFENSSKATIHTVMTEIRDTFCEDSEDTDFGSQQTYNTIDEDMFQNQLSFEKEKINRIPLYGINKLKDPSELSTDLFYSTFAYAGMANSYAAMSQVVDTLEVGKEVLNRRTVEGINSEESRLKDKSKAYNRYLKFLDKQVYGIGVPRVKIGDKVVLNKLFGFLTGFASKYFLGGNIAGGMVNVGTGYIEIFKEAFSGEYFDIKDWTKAHKSYYASFMQNWWGYGKEFKEDKVSLMIRHFNMLNESRTKQRGWHTRDSRVLNMFSESLFLPYKVGEHYMSSMSYLALANKIKLYDSNGNRISLFNAYKIVDIEDESGNADPKYGKTLKLEGTFFKNKESIKEYNLIQSIIGQIDNVLSNPSPFGSVLNLSQEELDYVNSKGYNLADMADVKAKLLDTSYKLTWTIDDESAFMDKAREINNRLHGIYNNQDKVAFQQNMFGNMLLAMRGYALGMLERRYGASKYSTILEGETEGSMRSLAKVIVSTFTDRGGFGLTMRAILLPVSKKTKQAMLNAGFSANQYYNMRRNMGDAMLILALTLLKMMTAKGGGDDDDKEEEVDTTTGIVYYFTSRLLREQEALTTIRGMSEEVPNLTNMTPVGVSALFDISNLAYQFGGSIVADEDDSEFYYQSRKSGMYEKGDAKWEAKFLRMFPYLRSNYVWEHPYEAAKSYEYGRKVRN